MSMACCTEAKKSHLTTSQIYFFVEFLSTGGENKSSYISGHQLLSIIQVLHGGHTLGAEMVVVRVGGHQQHVWNREFTGSHHSPVVKFLKSKKLGV